MKNLLFSFLLSCISPALFSQSFEIHDLQGNDVTGSTQFFSGGPQYTHSQPNYVVNTAATPKTVKAYRVEMSMVPGSYSAITFDMIGYVPSIDTSVIASAIPPGDSVYFQGDYFAGDSIGTSIIQYCFYDVNNPSDKSCLTAQYQALLIGIAENQLNVLPVVAFPSPADANVQFVIPAGYHGSVNLQLYDCSGKLISDSYHAQANCSLDLVPFRNGIYYYKLTDETGNIASGKLMVLHSTN